MSTQQQPPEKCLLPAHQCAVSLHTGVECQSGQILLKGAIATRATHTGGDGSRTAQQGRAAEQHLWRRLLACGSMATRSRGRSAAGMMPSGNVARTELAISIASSAVRLPCSSAVMCVSLNSRGRNSCAHQTKDVEHSVKELAFRVLECWETAE